MKKLNHRKLIPGLNTPGRLESILSTLFPNRTIRARKIEDVRQEEIEGAFFSPRDVATMAQDLPNGKAPEPDGIPNEVLKVAVGLHPQHFAMLFNKCISSAVFSVRWKVANLVLFRKPGKPLDNPASYRPLCMLNTVGKLFEKLLTARLREHLITTGNTTATQYGFKPGMFMVDAMSRVR